MTLGFLLSFGCVVLNANSNLDSGWVNRLLLVLLHHAVSCHQDATTGEQSPAAGEVPECGLFWGPLLARHGHYRRPVAAGSVTRRWPDVDPYMPRRPTVCQVICAEGVKFTTHWEDMKQKEGVKVKWKKIKTILTSRLNCSHLVSIRHGARSTCQF